MNFLTGRHSTKDLRTNRIFTGEYGKKSILFLSAWQTYSKADMGITEILTFKADKKYLVLVAGIIWCGVGIMLMTFAETWLGRYTGKGVSLFYAAGFLAALPIHLFGFSKLADRNMARLLEINERRSIFSFITVKSYLTIIFMVALGFTLRHSSIPKQYLSVIYNGIGLGLFLSGLKYIRIFFKLHPGRV